MAERVVDVLEVVQIDEQRGAGRAVAAVPGEQLLDAIHDQRPVRQAGQRVVQRLVAQLARALADQPQRPCSTGAEHQHERSEEDAQRDARQQAARAGSPR